MGWSDLPLSCQLSSRTGEVAYCCPQRVGVIHPLEYTNWKRSIKQPKGSTISRLYHSGNDVLMLSLDGPNGLCRAYLVSMQEV
jgi:hypothetical protein